MKTDKSQMMGLWETPSGRVHAHRMCSSGASRQNTRRAWITEEQWNRWLDVARESKGQHQPICRCARPWDGFRPGVVTKG